MPRSLAEAEARIAELEDCLIEFVPFAAAHDVSVVVTMHAPDTEERARRLSILKRDTLFLDKYAFRRAAHLMKDRMTANGAG
jgi:hypothetical protein